MGIIGDFEAKVAQVRGLLLELAVDGCLINSCHNFAWLTCGGRNNVPLKGEMCLQEAGCCGIVAHLSLMSPDLLA